MGALIFCVVDLQRYVSPDLTHFVGRSLPNQKTRFALLSKIIKQGTLKVMPRPKGLPAGVYEHGRHDGAKLSSNKAFLCGRLLPAWFADSLRLLG